MEAIAPNTEVTTTAIVAAVLLAGCSSGGGTPSLTVVTPPAIPPTGTTGQAVPAPGAPVTTQCTANIACGYDAIALSMPAAITADLPPVALDAPTTLGATALAAVLATGGQFGAGITGAINTSVATLTPLLGRPNEFTGIAANGQELNLAMYGTLVTATAASSTAGLSYSNFGRWQLKNAAPSVGTLTYSTWAGGIQVTTAMPTAGNAIYAGLTKGLSQIANTTYELEGRVDLTASFSATGGTVTGNISGITALNVNGVVPVAAGSFNDIALSGTITGNGFSGTATAGAIPAGTNPAAIAAGTVGTTAGHFYGPAANEISGIWGMSTTTVNATGSFGAKQ